MMNADQAACTVMLIAPIFAVGYHNLDELQTVRQQGGSERSPPMAGTPSSLTASAWLAQAECQQGCWRSQGRSLQDKKRPALRQLAVVV